MLTNIFRILLYFHISGMTWILAVKSSSGQLGSSCKVDGDCGPIEFSRCYQNVCSCLPFYAAYNSSSCLPSTMLGFECLIQEQCSKKVANSTCIDSVCRCEPGFLQFRRHTCLTGAKLGEVCYSDIHCRLSDMDTHCDFIIANLFGRCACNAPLRQSRSGMCLPNVPPPSTSTLPSLDFPYPAIIKVDNDMKPLLLFDNRYGATQAATALNSNSLLKPISNSYQKPASPTPITNAGLPQKTKKPQNGIVNQNYNSTGKIRNKISANNNRTADHKRPAVSSSSSVAKPTKYPASKPHKKHKPSSQHQQSSAVTGNNKPSKPAMIEISNYDDQKQSSTIKKSPVKIKDGTSTTSMAHKTDQKDSFRLTSEIYDLEQSTLIPTNLSYDGAKISSTESLHTATSSVQRGADNEVQDDDIISLGYRCSLDEQCMRSDNNSRCIGGVCDCLARRGRLEHVCSAKNTGCHKGTFQCRSTGNCISWFFVCDGRKDCSDGSDEDCKDKTSCPEYAYQCGSSVPAICISQATRCDGTLDCPNGEDELNCTTTELNGCPIGTFQCSNGECVPEYEFCNAIITCEDGSDEPKESCIGHWDAVLNPNPWTNNGVAARKLSTPTTDYCPFRCRNNRCRSSAVVCSGRDGCGDNSDEDHCTICKCPVVT